MLTILTYAVPAWAAYLSKKSWNKIEAAQNISLRMITGAPWFARHTTIQNSWNITSVADRIITLPKNFFYKTLKSNHKHISIIGRESEIPCYKISKPINILQHTSTWKHTRITSRTQPPQLPGHNDLNHFIQEAVTKHKVVASPKVIFKSISTHHVMSVIKKCAPAPWPILECRVGCGWPLVDAEGNDFGN